MTCEIRSAKQTHRQQRQLTMPFDSVEKQLATWSCIAKIDYHRIAIRVSYGTSIPHRFLIVTSLTIFVVAAAAAGVADWLRMPVHDRKRKKRIHKTNREKNKEPENKLQRAHLGTMLTMQRAKIIRMFVYIINKSVVKRHHRFDFFPINVC